MSGPTDFTFYAIVVISAVSAITDLCLGKIYNWLTLPAVLGGVAFAVWQGGWQEGAHAVLAAVLALALYGWMFYFGMMGGGDVKMLMALGAWGGALYAVNVALLGVLFGGVLAVGILVFQGRMSAFVGKMRLFFFSIFVKEMKVELPEIDRKLTMPYGVPIAAAAIAVAEGVRLWK